MGIIMGMAQPTDENTRLRLGRVLMDRIGVERDEFDEEDLDVLAACCRGQFIDLGPTLRVRVELIAGAALRPVDGTDPMDLSSPIALDVILISGGVVSTTMEQRTALELWNFHTGREVSPEVRNESGLTQ